ncbi:MAG: extracellular solute-binding protein [Chloroflexi bacterium]|nr:extracellular solute-binding protein [Chloroflexota bacterium]
MKKKLALALILVLVLTLTAAAAPSASARQDVTITWWHINTNEPEGAYWEQVANDYMAMNPDVNIEITVLENDAFKQRLVTVMQAGDPPDLFQSWGGGVLWEFVEAGMCRDISDELDGDWYDSFSTPAAVELFAYDGGYYGVPWTWGAVGMFYNKALFEEAGLDPDDTPETWDELLETVQVLKDAGITPIALGEGEKWPGHFWWVYLAIRLGGEEAFLDAYNRDGSFADEPFVLAGEYLQELVELEPFPEGFIGLNYGDQAGMMGDGRAAMELMGHWAPGAQAALSESGGIGDDLGWFPFPAIPEGEGNPDDVLGGGDGFAVGINAPDEAIEFLQYITSVEVQRAAAEIWVVPTVEGADEVLANDPIMAQVLEARNEAPYFQLYYDQFLPPAVADAVLDSVQALFAGEMSPEDVAMMIEDEAFFTLE